MIDYKQKYLKYKLKYLALRGGFSKDDPSYYTLGENKIWYPVCKNIKTFVKRDGNPKQLYCTYCDNDIEYHLHNNILNNNPMKHPYFDEDNLCKICHMPEKGHIDKGKYIINLNKKRGYTISHYVYSKTTDEWVSVCDLKLPDGAIPDGLGYTNCDGMCNKSEHSCCIRCKQISSVHLDGTPIYAKNNHPFENNKKPICKHMEHIMMTDGQKNNLCDVCHMPQEGHMTKS